MYSTQVLSYYKNNICFYKTLHVSAGVNIYKKDDS
jgi:hypothetical protein